MPLQHHTMNERTYFTLEPSPDKYFGPLLDVPQNDIQRLTVYLDNKKLMVWDIYLTDDTRFEAKLEVDPAFRFSEWIGVVTNANPGALDAFSRPNAVWVNVGEIIIEQEQALVYMHKTFSERGIMTTERIFVHGTQNKIIDLA